MPDKYKRGSTSHIPLIVGPNYQFIIIGRNPFDYILDDEYISNVLNMNIF